MALEDIQLPGQSQYTGREDDPDPYGEGRFWQAILKEGYVPLSQNLGGAEALIGGGAAYDPKSWDYFNKTYGTNIHSAADYYKIIYQQPNAEIVNDPRLGPLLNVGPGAVEKRFLNYNPNPNEELFQALKAGGLAFGAAGLLSAAGALGAGTAATGAEGANAALQAGSLGNAPGIGTGNFLQIGADVAGTGAGATLSAADIAGLTQMGQAAGLSGDALTQFVASGGTLGSTAAGGLGGAASIAEMFGLPTPGYVPPTYAQTGVGTPGVGDAGAFDQAGSAGSGIPGSGPASQASYASLYGPASAGFWESLGLPSGTGDTLSKLFPKATAGSLLGGLLQGGLGYLGAEKQADAIKSAQETQNAAIREAIAASEKARGEQNAAYAKAYDQSVAAREVQNDYIRQAIAQAQAGMASQDAAIQSGIDFSRGASDKYFGLGAPYRGMLESTYKPGYSVFDDSATRDAATQAANYAARGYSATSGNPFDQPSAQGGIYRDVLQQVALPQLNTQRNQLGTFGQTGLQQAGAFDALAAGGMANLGNNDLYAVPLTAQLGSNAFQGINYTANQADSGKYTDYLASLGNNAFQGTQNAGAGYNAIGYGLNQALNPATDLETLLKKLQSQSNSYSLKV